MTILTSLTWSFCNALIALVPVTPHKRQSYTLILYETNFPVAWMFSRNDSSNPAIIHEYCLYFGPV